MLNPIYVRHMLSRIDERGDKVSQYKLEELLLPLSIGFCVELFWTSMWTELFSSVLGCQVHFQFYQFQNDDLKKINFWTYPYC